MGPSLTSPDALYQDQHRVTVQGLQHSQLPWPYCHVAHPRRKTVSGFCQHPETIRPYRHLFPSDDNNTDTTAAPGFFAITSLSKTPPESDGAVFADWYSGVLSLGAPITKKNKKSKFKGNRLIYVRNGEVVDDQFLEKKDYERIGNITYKDTSDHKFMDKYRLAYLNQCFLSYYFQSGMNRDKVLFQGHTGRFSSVDFRPIIMSLFNYDPLQFPFNWENFERNSHPCAPGALAATPCLSTASR